MPNIAINFEGMQDLLSRLKALADKLHLLQNEISKSTTRLDWEVSQRDMIREQLSSAAQKARHTGQMTEQLKAFVTRAIHDFQSVDVRCANEHKQMTSGVEGVWKGFLDLESRIVNEICKVGCHALDGLKKACGIFVNRESNIQSTSLPHISSALCVPLVQGIRRKPKNDSVQKGSAPGCHPSSGIKSHPKTLKTSDNSASLTRAGGITPTSNLVHFITEYESFASNPYYASAAEKEKGSKTIGYGHVIKVGEHFDSPITKEQAIELFEKDLEKYSIGVRSLTKDVKLTQQQFDALVSFSYNVGLGAFEDSTLLKVIKRGGSDEEVKAQLDRWTRAGGEHLVGLWRRRQDEFEIWKNGEYKREFPEPPAGLS